MAEYIPFTPSDTNYTLVVPLDNVNYTFFVRWNSTAPGWFIDIYNSDQSIIVQGLRIVLGARLGRHSSNPWFAEHFLQVIDTSGTQVDAGYDDLGSRVQVVHMLISEFQRSTSTTTGA